MQAFAPARGWETVSKAIVGAVARSPYQHSLLLVNCSGITESVPASVSATLALISRSLDGRVTFAEMDSGNFVLFLEGRSIERAWQVARLIRAVIERELALQNKNVRIGILPIRGADSDIDALFDSAEQFCRSDSTHQMKGLQVEIVSLEEFRSPHESTGRRSP